MFASITGSESPWVRALATVPAEKCPSCAGSVALKGSSHKEAGQYCRRTLRSNNARNTTGAHSDNILVAEMLAGRQLGFACVEFDPTTTASTQIRYDSIPVLS